LPTDIGGNGGRDNPPGVGVEGPEPEPKPDRVSAVMKLRVKPDFAATAAVKKVLFTVPTGKPGNQVFFRCRAEEEFRPVFCLVDHKHDGLTYIIDPAIGAATIPGKFHTYRIYTVMTHYGVVQLWPVRLVQPGEKSNSYWDSAHEAASRSMSEWVQIQADTTGLKAYQITIPLQPPPEPTWPEQTIDELIDLAYRGRVIDDPDHEVIRMLQGRWARAFDLRALQLDHWAFNAHARDFFEACGFSPMKITMRQMLDEGQSL
jgi:hypothetical protein